MPFDLLLPESFRQQGWKVKIREKETREPPHATIIHGTKSWRINLRTGEFMDRHPNPMEVPGDLVDFIKGEETWGQLRAAWDSKYPTNPVQGADNE